MTIAAPPESGNGPTLLTWALPQVGSLGYAGHGADAVEEAAQRGASRFRPLTLDIATFAEMRLPALSISTRFGLFAPKGTPEDIIGKLNAAAVEALADPAVLSRLADLGFQILPRAQQTPERLADIEKWWPIIKEFGINAELGRGSDSRPAGLHSIGSRPSHRRHDRPMSNAMPFQRVPESDIIL